MAKKIGENLYRLDIPLPDSPLRNLNSYLFTGERNLLVDTDFRKTACREAMAAELAALGVDMDRTDLFLTHLHTDHTGLAQELLRPGCRAMLGAADVPVLIHSQTERYWEENFADSLAEGFPYAELHALWGDNPARDIHPVPFDGYTPVEPGTVLRYGGYALTCIATPGHSPGHMCLYDRAKKLLVCGDHVLYHISPNITRWRVMEDALGSYLASLDAVAALEVETPLPAHRGVEGPFRERVMELRAHHARRLADTLEAVRRRPGQTAYEVAGAMRWDIRCRSWEDFPLTQKWFAVGEALSHLDYLVCRGQIIRREEDGLRRYDPAEGDNKTAAL